MNKRLLKFASATVDDASHARDNAGALAKGICLKFSKQPPGQGSGEISNAPRSEVLIAG